MGTVPYKRFRRTDVWREGKWLDLWSVVHFLSGVSIGFGLYFFHFGELASIALVFLALVCYEMWEVIVHIEETPTNRFMDVVVGMAGFLPIFFLLAPLLSRTLLILAFALVFITDIVMSISGWHASQKAAALTVHMQASYMAQRARLLERSVRLRRRFPK